MTTVKLELPPKLIPVFAEPRGAYDYRYAHGGRGSAKSASFATMSAVFGMVEPIRILCVRELQVSIKESLYAEVKRSMDRYDWLGSQYDVGVDYIRAKNGTEYLFRGLRHNLSNIKSLTNIGLVLIEEAEDVNEEAWDILTGTIREPKAEIWPIWNPKLENSPVDTRFRKNTPKRSIGVELNWRDNPWFSERQRREMEFDRERDPVKYQWKWEGKYLNRTDAQVFKNWRIDEFEAPKDAQFRLGADWGFATDPSVLIRCYIQGPRLFIDHEAYLVGCRIESLPALFMTVPDSERYAITADSSRPETIDYMRRNGFSQIMPAVKGPKSVEEGIEWLQNFEIVVHPRCKHTIEELTVYSYKRDKLTDELMHPPTLEDKHNHLMDALRYACEGARRAPKPRQTTRREPIRGAGAWMG